MLLNTRSHATTSHFKSRNESELVAHSKPITELEEKFGFAYVENIN